MSYKITKQVINQIATLKGMGFPKGSAMHSLLAYINHLENPVDNKKLNAHLKTIIDSKEVFTICNGTAVGYDCHQAILVGYDDFEYTFEFVDLKVVTVLSKLDLQHSVLANIYQYLTMPFN